MQKMTADFSGTKILLVEDYVINQELTTAMLQKMHCEVDLAEDGEQAIEKFDSGSYDFIIMDIQIPKLDGYAVTQHIRGVEKKSGTHTPIVAVTANALDGDEEKCLKAGMDDYLSKPIKGANLEAMLQKYL